MEKKKKPKLVDSLILIAMLILCIVGGFFLGRAYTYIEINTALIGLDLAICEPVETFWYNQSVQYTRFFNTYNVSELIELDRINKDWLKCHELMELQQNG